MGWLLSKLFRDGNKEWAHLTADDERELADAERRLKAKRHGKGHQQPHLDLTPHQAELARRYGAEEE